MMEIQNMNELQNMLIEYLKQYVKLLTSGRQEFFLSLCDIEEEPLGELNGVIFDEYVTIIVDKSDYSEAVRVRNDIEIKKIVLLSGEGVKQIDSLKDFNEYSIMSNDKDVFWTCVQKAFKVKIHKEVIDCLNIILDEGEVPFWEFFKYLYAGIEAGEIVPQKLNRNLSCLGIWSSTEKKALTKGKIRRMIRYSKDVLIERRLTKALMENRIKKWERTISGNLAKGDIQAILDKVPYEDIKDYLKGPTRNNEIELPTADDTVEEERGYACSYEYAIKEHIRLSIEDIENGWLEEKERDISELDWSVYNPIGNEEIHKAQIKEIQDKMKDRNMPESKITQFSEKLSKFYELFQEAYPKMINLTPICLSQFCDMAIPYTQAYFDLLSYVLTDEMTRKWLLNAGIVSRLQCLFCDVEEAKIRMPFYHPVSVMYYIALKKMYEFIIKQEACDEIADITEQTLLALVKKLSKQFPVEFMRWNGQLYAIDYTTVQDKGIVEFTDAQKEVVYSALDFRVIYKQIVDYIIKHSVCTEITIALVEISDLNGLLQIVEKIRQMSSTDKYNIGRVDFLILSSKEEALKKQLSQMWDIIGTDEIVRFRFGRNNFYDEKGYDIKKIIEAADMTVIADSSTLYYEPRMEPLRQGINPLRNRLTQMNIQEQADNYFNNGYSDIAVLWDTLQHTEDSRDDGFWYWKSKEIDSNVLSYINQAVSEDSHRTIVALSSNDNILNDIYKSNYIQAHRRKYNGKSITIINFDSNNELNSLPIEGNASITYSLTEFYDTSLDIQKVSAFISPEISDIVMTLYLQEGEFHSLCTAYEEETTEEDKKWQEKCEKWLIWQLETFPNSNNILSNYLSELWVNQWSEGARSITAALLVRKLYGGGNIETHYDHKPSCDKPISMSVANDCMEVVKIQEILEFIDKKVAIDSQAMQQFCDRYEPEMLDRIIECDLKENILKEEQRHKLLEIKQKIKGE